METTLEKAEKEFEKISKKLERLKNSLENINDETRRVTCILKIEQAEHLLIKAEYIYLGKKMEQAGRDLSKAAKQIPQTRGETEIIINALQKTPKKKDLKEEFNKADIDKEITKIFIEHALDKIEETYYEIFPDDDDEDDDEEDVEKFDPTEPITPNYPPTGGDDDEEEIQSDEITIIENFEPPIPQRENDKVQPLLPNESDPFIIINPDPFIEDPD